MTTMSTDDPSEPRAARGPRFVLYSHDGVGIGHVARNLKIAGAITRSEPTASVLLVTSSPAAERFVVPAGVDLLRLPAIRKLSNGHYGTRRLRLTETDILAFRGAQIAAAVTSLQPDVLVADKHPAGVGGELLPAIDALDYTGGRAVIGFRDILDDPVTVRREWSQERTLDLIAERYDRVLVYGQPEVLDFAAAYAVPWRVSRLISYIGYIVDEAGRDGAGEVVASVPAGPRSPRPVVLACAGGGEDGASLLTAFAKAARGAFWRGVAVTGPEFAPALGNEFRDAAADAGVEVRTFSPDLPSWLRSADAAVCMGGYNTLADALSFGTPTICIPRTSPRSEQLLRAEAFARMGLLSLLRPETATPQLLGQAIARACRAKRSDLAARARSKLDFDGSSRAASHLLRLAASGPRPVAWMGEHAARRAAS